MDSITWEVYLSTVMRIKFCASVGMGSPRASRTQERTGSARCSFEVLILESRHVVN